MGITRGGHSVEGTVGKHLACMDIYKLAQLFCHSWSSCLVDKRAALGTSRSGEREVQNCPVNGTWIG